MPAPEQPTAIAPPPTAGELFALFCRIGLTSFGGGVSSWLFREMVRNKRWIAEEEFLTALALCQALPGLNVTNIAVWMGNRFQGARGVAFALAGIVVLPSILIVLIGLLFAFVLRYPLTQVAMTGAVAAAVGLPFSMGLLMASRLRRALPLAVMAGTFAAIGIFRLPLLWVVLVAGTLSIAGEHRIARRMR